MKCLIIDDQEIYHLILANLMALEPSLTLIGSYLDPLEAHRAIQQNDIDLLLLDIEMPEMNGIQLAKILGDKGPLIIFITSRADYAVEAFNLNVVDYLVKPIEPDRFLKSIEKAKNILKSKDLIVANESGKDGFVFIRDSYTIKRIKIDDILYFEANRSYVEIHMSSNHIYSIHSSITSLEQKLPPSFFLRVHRSYIVNLGKIDKMEGKTLIINEETVPIADAYKANLNERMIIL